MRFFLFMVLSSKILATTKISTGIFEIRKSIDKFTKNEKTDLKSNPLENISFDSYYSRYFLYGYRALGNYLLAKNTEDKAEKLELLKKSLYD